MTRFSDIDPEAKERILAGYNRCQDAELGTFADAMAHELDANDHKGDPNDVTALGHVSELIYHAAKLYMALRFGAREAALEYAADIGNHAWMAANRAHVLDLDLLTEGLEGQRSGLYEEDAEGNEFTPDELERLLREQPWRFKPARGGFYEELKELSRRFPSDLARLVDTQQVMHGRRVPEVREALGGTK